jgi:hypothetical protein
VGTITMLFGDILTAYGLSPVISLTIIGAILVGVIYLWGRRIE